MLRFSPNSAAVRLTLQRGAAANGFDVALMPSTGDFNHDGRADLAVLESTSLTATGAKVRWQVVLI